MAAPRKPTKRKDPAHEPALFNACRKGELAKVKKLLAEGADPLHAKNFVPPLVASVLGGSVEVVQVLLDAGAQADHGAEAVAWAAGWDSQGKKAVFDLLVARGALTARTGARTSGLPARATPLGVLLHGFEAALATNDRDAKAHKELEQVELQVRRILEAGADPETPSGGHRPVEQVRRAAALYDEREIAATMSERVVALLVKHGAKP